MINKTEYRVFKVFYHANEDGTEKLVYICSHKDEAIAIINCKILNDRITNRLFYEYEYREWKDGKYTSDK